MNDILTLTEEQKARLHGMAAPLWRGHTIKSIEKDGTLFIQIGEGKQFHWFEFCFTLLAEKVIQYNHEKFGDFAYTTMLKTVHPVDFLWDVYFNKR